MERKLKFLEKEIKKDEIPMLVTVLKIPLIPVYFDPKDARCKNYKKNMLPHASFG